MVWTKPNHVKLASGSVETNLGSSGQAGSSDRNIHFSIQIFRSIIYGFEIFYSPNKFDTFSPNALCFPCKTDT
jgi:hypothetical protein